MKVETQDFYLSAFLLLNRLDIIELKNYGERKLFVFRDTPKFQELKQQYYWNKAKVDPMIYKQHIRELKEMILQTN